MRQRTFMPQQLAEIEVVDLRSAQLARVAVVRRLAVTGFSLRHNTSHPISAIRGTC